jgi:hypothetical protein
MLKSILGATKFDQYVLNLALINLCDRESETGQDMRGFFNVWRSDTDEDSTDPWRYRHQFIIGVPHPDQEFEGWSLAEGLNRGYNIEAKPIAENAELPYKIPAGGHFVIVTKQKSVNGDFEVVATGIFVRPLGALQLDILVDPDKSEYQSVVIKHPIIREYPAGWEQKLRSFLNGEISGDELPDLVNYVDRASNRDYHPPGWNELYLAASGFQGV